MLDQLSACTERPNIKDIFLVQDYVLFFLVLFRPTMRSQNFVLEVMEKLQTPKEADKNGIVFPSDNAPVVLQLTKYKTAQRYGYLQFYLTEEQSIIMRKFISVRVWAFPNPQQPTHNFLFIDQRRQPLLKIGKYFKAITESVLNKNISISCIRKIMESSLSELNCFDVKTRNALSAAMLHDPATARRYYVSIDMQQHSKEINDNW